MVCAVCGAEVYKVGEDYYHNTTPDIFLNTLAREVTERKDTVAHLAQARERREDKARTSGPGPTPGKRRARSRQTTGKRMRQAQIPMRVQRA